MKIKQSNLIFSGVNVVVDSRTLDFETEMLKILLNKTAYPPGLDR